jgi:predicted transglutaminase-like cysteine proteinase
VSQRLNCNCSTVFLSGASFRATRPICVWALAVCALLCFSVALAVSDLSLMERLANTRYGAEAAASVSTWRNMIADSSTLPETEQIERVNRFINNRTRFEEDIVVWRQPDYWASPLELLAKRAGDCEDFAITKYATLRILGIPAEKLRLTYVRARIGAANSNVTQAHMVLSYYATPSADPLILDNLIAEIRPATRRPDLLPVFSFNHTGLWVAGTAQSAADPTARLSRWRDVLERMRREGVDLS